MKKHARLILLARTLAGGVFALAEGSDPFERMDLPSAVRAPVGGSIEIPYGYGADDMHR